MEKLTDVHIKLNLTIASSCLLKFGEGGQLICPGCGKANSQIMGNANNLSFVNEYLTRPVDSVTVMGCHLGCGGVFNLAIWSYKEEVFVGWRDIKLE